MNSSKLRSRIAFALPIAFTIGWAIYVTASGQWDRVATVWATSTTMIFGGFVAGSTPQGGGAVAFPVFTKLLLIDNSIARTFALSVQASGMVMAAATILITGRKIIPRAVVLGTAGGLVGFLFGAYVLSDPSDPWWVSTLPSDYVKVGFTLAIAAMALIVRNVFAGGSSGTDTVMWTSRSVGMVVVFGFLGGVASALAGSGADVLLFMFLSAVMGVHPRVGIPTSIVTMAIISVAGLVLFGIVGGQLGTVLDADGFVVATRTQEMSFPLEPERFDVFGIWLGAVPVVALMAPIGAYVASIVSEKILIGFVLSIGIAEVISTVFFLDALRTDIALAAFLVIGLFGAFGMTRVLARAHTWVMGSDAEHCTPLAGGG